MGSILDWAASNPEAAIALLVVLANVAIEAIRKVAPNVAASLGGLSPVYVRAIVDGIRRALEARKTSSALPPGTSVLLLLSLVTGAAGALGCASPTHAAVVAANATRDAGEVAREVLYERCTLGYARTSDAATIASLDRFCLPLRDAYRGLRGAHLALVTAIQVAQARGSVAALPGAIADAAAAGELVARAVGGDR